VVEPHVDGGARLRGGCAAAAGPGAQPGGHSESCGDAASEKRLHSGGEGPALCDRPRLHHDGPARGKSRWMDGLFDRPSPSLRNAIRIANATS